MAHASMYDQTARRMTTRCHSPCRLPLLVHRDRVCGTRIRTRTILGQYWSVSRLHCLQSRQARVKQPTPARSPTFQPLAPAPTSVTMPTISCLRRVQGL